jgi:O-antigen ligase
MSSTFPAPSLRAADEPIGQPQATAWMPRIPAPAIASAAVVLAVVAGHFFADGRMTYAGALVLAVCYGPLVVLNLPLAFAVYVAVLFVQDISALSVGPNSMGVLVLLGWLGTFVNRSARTGVLREHSRLLLSVALFALWLTLSDLWAVNTYEAGNGIQNWLTAILALIVVVSTLRNPKNVATVASAFIAGAVTSVIYGIASGALSAAATSASETSQQGRFTGGGGDPNVQAAGFLVAMFLCAGLWSLARTTASRLMLGVAFIAVAVGFFATQSRGGFVSLGIAAVTGFVLLPRQRKRLLGLAGAAGVGFGVIAALSPGAVARITDIGGGTSGRSDVWAVAWKVFTDHPWLGVGISNFQTVEPHYALKAGSLSRIELIVEVPHYVHNVYLQMLTETGVIGLAVFLLAIVGCLHASWRAARRFDAIGRVAYGDLARAVLLGEIAMLSALFFISDGEDPRLWILLGLGPVMLSLARRMGPASAAPSTAAAGVASQLRPAAASSS